MGYRTEFTGQFVFDRPLSDAQRAYLEKFARTRRVRRDAATTAQRPDPVRVAAGLPVGDEGAFFVGAGGDLGQEGGGPLLAPGGQPPEALGILDFNSPPAGQPHLWCCWAPDAAGTALLCPAAGEHYEFVSWLRYLLRCFIIPWGYSLDGEVAYRGEAAGDRGRIVLQGGQVAHLPEGGAGRCGEGTAAFELGQRLFQAKRFDEALACFADAVERAPSWADPLWMKGVALGRLGREDEGLALLDRAIAAEPAAQERTMRRRKLHAILAATGRGGQGLERGRGLRSQSRFAEALEEYEGYLEALPEQARAGEAGAAGQVGAGLCCQGLGRRDEALLRYEAAIAASPQDALGWMCKASLLSYQLGRPADAAEAYRRAIGLGEATAEMFTELGLCLQRSATLREAAQAFEQAIAADGGCALAWYNLGNVLLQARVPKGALDCFERALALGDPRCAEHAAKGADQARRALRGGP
ncbi:MAG: tetratricopeptide repeat protein [Elusimicrobia bacterium]|nr:tetratricopeptide repeat protein [Elusimicrobiota bacterium]